MTSHAHGCTRAVILNGFHKGQRHRIAPNQTTLDLERESLDSADQSDARVVVVHRYIMDKPAINDPGVAGFVFEQEMLVPG